MFLLSLLLMAQQNGSAWTNIGPSPAAVKAFAVDPRGSGTIFVGTFGGGVRKSVDGGITWSAVNTGLTDLRVESLAMDASGPQTVYAGTFQGVFNTDDGGATWHNVAASPNAADPNPSGVVYGGGFHNLTTRS